MSGEVTTAYEDLESTKTKVMESIENLEKKWNTPAGKKFRKNTDLEWGKEVDKYIKVLKSVVKLLDEAEKQFGLVKDEIEKINY